MLHVPADLATSWQQLPAPARAHLVTFLSDRPAAAIEVDGMLPAPFAADLARGGLALRAAFPRLERIVVAIDGSAVRIRSCGVHDGLFYGLVRPTGRAVQFVEHHTLGLQAAARIAIDLAAIVRQLGASYQRPLIAIDEPVACISTGAERNARDHR